MQRIADVDVEMTDVDALPPSSDSGSSTSGLIDSEIELRHLLEREMDGEPDDWMSVSTRLQEKPRQDLMLEIMGGDPGEGEPREIALLCVLDELVKLLRGGLRVDLLG